MDKDLVSIFEAAAILDLSVSHARRVLQFVDDREELGNGQFRALYYRCRVLNLAQERACRKCEADKLEKHLRSCRTCRNKFKICDLTSGKCQKCRAFDMCRNYACHNDCFKCPEPDCTLIDNLQAAIDHLREKAKRS
jgi:hypothetical protein